jgi:alpha,alpha-trehalose phosphorylase
VAERPEEPCRLDEQLESDVALEVVVAGRCLVGARSAARSARAKRTTASAMSAPMWKAAVPAGQYESLTARDSSLSASTQAVIAAEVGHLELAYDYFAEAALIDVHDLQHNTRDGVHIASLAGAWIAAVAGFGGMRDHDGKLTFAPRLPTALPRLAFRLRFRGRRLEVEITKARATYTLLDGEPLEIGHHGQPIRVETGVATTQPIESPLPRTSPAQPHGRARSRRTPDAERLAA